MGAKRAGTAGRDLGGVAVSPRCDAQRPPPRRLHGDANLGRYHGRHDLVAVHRLRQSLAHRAQRHMAGAAGKRCYLFRGRGGCHGVRAGGAVFRGARQVAGGQCAESLGGAERQGSSRPATGWVGDGHPGRRTQRTAALRGASRADSCRRRPRRRRVRCGRHERDDRRGQTDPGASGGAGHRRHHSA
ncbi:Uncharacterised protein [Mycobacterium tuberculosis]|nr:Uncharacterised protein [Mycobacterium tuberculosis]